MDLHVIVKKIGLAIFVTEVGLLSEGIHFR